MKCVRCFTSVYIYDQKVEKKNLLYTHLYKYTCQPSFCFSVCLICRKYWRIVQHCYWLLDSFNHNRITRLETRLKKRSYLSAIVTHIISGDITSPRQGWKFSQNPHIRDSKFWTKRITFIAWQMKCDPQAREKHRDKRCQNSPSWWQGEYNFWDYKKKLRQVKVCKVYLMDWNNNHVVFLLWESLCIVCAGFSSITLQDK